jgi:subtilisin family serine protease
VVVLDMEPNELRTKLPELSEDSVVEPVLPRYPARARPLFALPTPGLGGTNLGTGAVMSIELKDESDNPVPRATVSVTFVNRLNPTTRWPATAVSDASGNIQVAYDPSNWVALLAFIEPASGLWQTTVFQPSLGLTVKLRSLPKQGPLGWWHRLSGVVDSNPLSGQGVKIGIIDTGVGPHPYLNHAVPVGAFLNGSALLGEANGRDVSNHGTHVSGIIAARPPQDSSDYAGIASGADLFVARVFATATSEANQGDIASAIDELSQRRNVDIINMSLGQEVGGYSRIDYDAVTVAYQHGTVCVCAAGNYGKPSASYPAAYPECIAVSALGLVDAAPQDTFAGSTVPQEANKYAGRIFLANFSNYGPEIFICAPGNGIISTVPVSGTDPAPYADESGTSMSAPLTAGILAVLLSRVPEPFKSERSRRRSDYLRVLLCQHALSLNLNLLYQGNGLARIL